LSLYNLKQYSQALSNRLHVTAILSMDPVYGNLHETVQQRRAPFSKSIKQFVDSHGTSNCGVLRERFGEEQQMTECRKLVREGTVALLKSYRDRK